MLPENALLALQTLSKYYCLTREQMGRFQFPGLAPRTVRKHIKRLLDGGYAKRHPTPVVLPGQQSAQPVYYVTRIGAEQLADQLEDERYLRINTRPPAHNRLAHWLAVSNTRYLLEQATNSQSEVNLVRFYNEWEQIDKTVEAEDGFSLHTQFSETPPLSFSPDGAFLLEVHGHRKVMYLEQDRGTSSPKQIGARRWRGAYEASLRQLHFQHFPDATIKTFSILFITTTYYRRDRLHAELRERSGKELWLSVCQKDITAENFFTGAHFRNSAGELRSLIKHPSGATSQIAAATAAPS